MNSGSYQLLIRVHRNCEIEIGKLGQVSFRKGFYVYTGSAMKNLKQRVDRHRRPKKKLHWHIDYFLADENVELLDIRLFPSAVREECKYNQELIEMPGSWVPKKGLGSTDCSQCPSHLIGIR